MDRSKFTANSPGRLVLVETGVWAYVPNPLPPQLNLSWELVQSLSAADRALSELAGAARSLPNPHLLIRPFIRREAVLSSRIEGTMASLSELLLYEGGQHLNEKTDVHEVANYVLALEYGLARLDDLPLSVRLLLELHGHLMSGVRGQNQARGELRGMQNWIGPPGSTKQTASYIPPPVPEMKQCLFDLEKFLHQPTILPPLLKLALVHYQFEAIHPFFDGNGRIGRLLITLGMCAEGLLPQPLLYLSAFFEKHKKSYYELLLAVSQEGAWEDWLKFFLLGVSEQSHDAIDRSRKLLDLWQIYRDHLQTARASGLQLKLLDFLFTSPAFTATQISKTFEVTPRAAQQNIDKLVDARILREVTGRQRNRIYLATEILAVTDSEKT